LAAATLAWFAACALWFAALVAWVAAVFAFAAAFVAACSALLTPSANYNKFARKLWHHSTFVGEVAPGASRQRLQNVAN